MADHSHDGHGDHASHGDFQGDEPRRTTSPMQDFSTSQVGTGLVILVVGLIVTFGIPLVAV
jgi:hypothetical protein